MHRQATTVIAICVGALVLALAVSLAADRPAPTPVDERTAVVDGSATPAVNEQVALEVVANHEVCMVNDTFFARQQIPVEVEGQTYYGCCDACKQRLAEDEEVRYAVDPTSGERVDKATALIVARPDGSVLYFASQENLAAHRDGDGT